MSELISVVILAGLALWGYGCFTAGAYRFRKAATPPKKDTTGPTVAAVLLLTTAAIPLAKAQTPQVRTTLATPIAASSATAVPMLLRYDGSAPQSDGRPMTGANPVTFLVYKEEQGGEALWTETQSVLFDTSGKYQVYLGSTSSSGLPAALFGSGEARWLEVQVAGETPEPRTLLTSVPYAMNAATLGGLPASAFALAGTTGTLAVTANGITPDASAASVTTTGGTNFYLPRFNAATTVVNSEIYDTGTSVGIGDVPTTSAKLDVNGAMILRGGMKVLRMGNATASTAYPSYGIEFFSNAYNSSTTAVDGPYFQVQSEPTGNNTASPSATFNLLFANNGSAAAETGLYFNPNGTIHFASGQTFPGTGTGGITGVAAGTGLTGGGTTGTVKLSVDSTKIPTLTGNNSLTGSNTFVASLYEAIDVNIDSTNRNPGTISPGLRFGIASGEGMSSKRTSGGNQYGLDLYTNYQPRLSINAAGQVAIGTGSQFNGSQLQVQSASGNAVQGQSTSGFGVQGSSTSSYGVYGTSSTSNGVSGSTGGTSLYTAGVLGSAGARTSFQAIAGVWGDAAAHVGVFGSSTQYPGVAGASTQGQGVQGISTAGTGVQGTSASSYGVEGTSAAAAGVIGVSTTNSGVYGVSNDTIVTDDVAGVFGYAAGALPAVKGHNVGSGPAGLFIGSSPTAASLTAYNNGTSSGTATAILGVGSQEGGIGVEGQTIGGIALLGAVGVSAPGNRLTGYAGNVAVWGDATLGGVAVIGSASSSNAGYFSNNSDDSTIYAVNYGSGNTGQDVRLFGALEAATPDGSCGIGGKGDLTCTGQVKTLATTGNGERMVETYSMQSPENWMEDFGSGTLQHGSATVPIEAAFAETVSGTADYHVFLTPRGDSQGLYVTNTTAASFEVHESGGGTSTLGFDYRIVAKRRGFETQRMVDVTDAMKAVKARNELQAAHFKSVAKTDRSAK